MNEDGPHEYGPDALALLQHLRVLVADGGQVHPGAQRHPADVPQVAPLPRQRVHVDEVVVEVEGEVAGVGGAVGLAAVLHVPVSQHLGDLAEVRPQHLLVDHRLLLLPGLIRLFINNSLNKRR